MNTIFPIFLTLEPNFLDVTLMDRPKAGFLYRVMLTQARQNSCRTFRILLSTQIENYNLLYFDSYDTQQSFNLGGMKSEFNNF